ncbi:MAG: hypothetical protein JW825_04095 [Candidatus Methanofastidiosa archaeon]|nr:hypothetical protein [Candidatus Methanofastidiosa archaeon]
MNKAVWILLGIILIAIGVFLAVPQGGIDWSEELVAFLKGGIIIVLIMAGLFAFLMAKLE